MKKRDQQRSVTTLFIKNMVCNRCIRVVGEDLAKLGFQIHRIVLGEVDVSSKKPVERERIQSVLEENGFELIEDRRVKIIERIKVLILKLVQNDYAKNPLPFNYSEYLARELGHDYRYLSSLFSSVEGITIEHYTILQRIERVKELIKYGDTTLSEIAYTTGYSSVQHLSNQFRKVTGMTPSYFKNLKKSLRKPLDHVTTK